MTIRQPPYYHLQQEIRSALADRAALCIRGGGSKDFLGPRHSGRTLETSALSGIISYEPSELVATVAAGTTVAELEATLAGEGQCLPFEPPHFCWNGAARATIGGMVASGLCGPARAASGGLRDYVLGVSMINGRAEHLTFGGQVMKNVAGYDVSRLMVGAMGTLGVLTQVSLKVLPIAASEATLVFEADQSTALHQLQRWLAQPLPLNASCWVRDSSPQAPAGRDLLFVRLRGARSAVESGCTKMLGERGGVRMANAMAQPDWERCRNQTLPFFVADVAPDMALWRLSVPQTTPPLAISWPQLIEWHGALRWLWAPLDAGDGLRQEALRAGGSASLFVAPRSVPQAYFPLAVDEAELAIARRLKASFDPQGIFNPGRLYPGF
jgi:glycolate oxidase FAD binding subunit